MSVTGFAELALPAAVGAERSASFLLWEAQDPASVLGPLLLTVHPVDASNPSPLTFVSVLGGYGFGGVAEDPWGEVSAPFVIGQLQLDIIQGAVHRTVYADLTFGTFQLPPCDSVRATVRLKRVGLVSAESVYEMQVFGSIRPGWMPNAKQLVVTDGALFDGGANVDVSHVFIAPAFCEYVRCAVTQIWDGGIAGFASPQFRLGGFMYIAGKLGGVGDVLQTAQPIGEWAPVVGVRFMNGVYICDSGDWQTFASVQWRVDL